MNAPRLFAGRQTPRHFMLRNRLYAQHRPRSSNGSGNNGRGGNNGGNGGGGGGGEEGHNGARRWTMAAAVACGMALAAPQHAAARDNARDKGDVTVNYLSELVGPMITNYGFSGLCGACCAAAVKTVGRIAAFTLGFIFIGVQVMAYYGVITVNWAKLQQRVEKAFDQTGDGRFDKRDFDSLSTKFMSFMSQGLPTVAGFSAGFLLGLKVF